MAGHAEYGTAAGQVHSDESAHARTRQAPAVLHFSSTNHAAAQVPLGGRHSHKFIEAQRFTPRMVVLDLKERYNVEVCGLETGCLIA
jgi:hypothetical protein